MRSSRPVAASPLPVSQAELRPELRRTVPPASRLSPSAQSGPATDWDSVPVTNPSILEELPLANLQPTLSILSSGVYATVDVLVDRPLRIGREADNDIRLPGDLSMSRHHALFTPSAEGLFVEDVGSTNGTFVNGRRIARAPLNHNDRLRIGDTLLQVRYDSARPSSSRTPVPSPSPSRPRGPDGEVLRAWRKQQGLSQVELAARLGVSQRTVSLWEQGAPISAANRKNLREKAGCNVL